MPLTRAYFKAVAISNSGSVAVLFALLTPVLFLMIGLAVDYTNSVRIKTAIQSEADSAVLAAASFIGPEAEALTRAEAYIDNALAKRGLTNSTTAKSVTRDDDTDDFVVSLTYRMPTRFAGLAGFRSFELDVRSAAAPKAGTRVLDIAMCIDATGSMQPTIDAVKTNALNFYTTLNAELAARRLEKFDAVQVRPIFFRDFGGNWRWYDVASGGKVDKYPLGFENRPAGDAKNYGDDVSMRAAADFFQRDRQAGRLASLRNA
jgi:Putative Flp pilus-assembly TadE/G-like